MPGSGSGMLRLADFALHNEGVDIEDALRAVRDLEQEYRATIAPALPNSGQGTDPKDFFDWANELASMQTRLKGLEHWEQIEHQRIAPHVNQVLQAIPRVLQGHSAEQWEAWRDRYIPRLLELLSGFRREATEKSRARAHQVAAAINPVLPESKHKESLSRKALWVLVSTPGITCVLNGMRTVPYVDDSTAVLGWSWLSNPQEAYKAVARLSGL
jgi:hypothetical protein